MEQLKQHLKDRNTNGFALDLCKKIVDKKQSSETENIDVPDSKNRSKLLQFRVSEEEFEKINKRFEKSYCKSLSEYLRTSALSCVNMVVDEAFFKDCTRKISGVANNLNQIAARMNSLDRLYADDIAEIKEGAEQIWQLQISILSELHSVNQFSTSLTETKPETASLLLAVAVHLMHKLQQDNLSKSESVEQEEVPF